MADNGTPRQASLVECNAQLRATMQGKKPPKLKSSESSKSKTDDGNTGDNTQTGTIFDDYEIEKLREFGKDAAIRSSHNMGRDKLIAKLVEAEYKPESSE